MVVIPVSPVGQAGAKRAQLKKSEQRKQIHKQINIQTIPCGDCRLPKKVHIWTSLGRENKYTNKQSIKTMLRGDSRGTVPLATTIQHQSYWLVCEDLNT